MPPHCTPSLAYVHLLTNSHCLHLKSEESEKWKSENHQSKKTLWLWRWQKSTTLEDIFRLNKTASILILNTWLRLYEQSNEQRQTIQGRLCYQEKKKETFTESEAVEKMHASCFRGDSKRLNIKQNMMLSIQELPMSDSDTPAMRRLEALANVFFDTLWHKWKNQR